MTRVLIVQHGEKEPAPGDPGLTRVGHEQASATAAWLAATASPSALYSSPLRRAIETAQAIAERLGLPIDVEPRLRERMNWDGPGVQPLEGFLAEWAHATADRDFVPTSGDSSRQAGSRLLAALDELADRHADETIAVVSHGGVTVDLLRTLVGDDAVRASAPTLLEQGVPCYAITTLGRTGGAWQVGDIASTSHLASSRLGPTAAG